MLTLLLKNGFRFFFFLSEPKYKAPHVHVEKGIGGGVAIFWLEPNVCLQKSKGLNQKDISIAKAIVLEYQKEFLEKYYEFISPKHK